jgi:hypothetical protein
MPGSGASAPRDEGAELRTHTCGHCRATIIWWQSPAGSWQAHTASPVPWAPGRDGIVLHRRRGWVDAGTAWPEPEAMLPLHRCASHADSRESWACALPDLAGAWLPEAAEPRLVAAQPRLVAAQRRRSA